MRVVLALAVLVATAATASANTPLPARGDHSVYDAAGVIDETREQQLEATNTELMQRAGVAVVVVTVPKLVDETIAELAVRVQQEWGVGVKGKDEGVVIALAVEDRKIFLATGYGSEGYLPDGKVGEIRDRATPALRANDFAAGLVTADLAIAQVAAAAHNVTLTGVPAIAAPRGADEPSNVVTLIFLGVFALVAIGGMFRGRGGRGGGGGFGSFAAGALLGSLFGRGGGGGGGGDGGGGGFGGFGGGGGGGGGAGGSF
jgi:uncharacterized protein